MRLVVCLALIVMAVAAACGPRPPPAAPGPSARALAATVIVLSSRGYPTCAGEYISPDVIATAYHCLDNVTGCETGDDECYTRSPGEIVTEGAFEAWNGEGEPAKVEVCIAAVDPWNDIALLRSARPSPDYVTVQISVPWPGDPIFTIGHPDNVLYTIAGGFIVFPLVMNDSVPMIAISAPVGPGSSGGGLFNRDGELLGIVTLRYDPGRGGLAVPSSTLAVLIDAASHPEQPLRGGKRLGCSIVGAVPELL